MNTTQPSKPINIFIAHYNTPELTEALVKSINKFVPKSKIYIFDSSDTRPFLYMQSNIVYIDNTEGQVINVDDVLSTLNLCKLPKGPIVNNYASLRHTLVVQKWIDMVDENFIFLDSDILLKKDITELFDEDYLWIADTAIDCNRITRVAPYIMFLNIKEMKEKNYTFYNPNYMHGISGPGNIYDTGAYLYKITKNDKTKEIDLKDYIVHYGAGSWKKYQEIKKNIVKVDPKIWLDNNRKYWKTLNKNNKTVIYTAITGKYDDLLYQDYVDDNFDYVCFTDDPALTSGLFNIVQIPQELNIYSSVKKQRNIKINPHLYLKKYETSVWIDANIKLKGNPLELIDDENYIFIPVHPFRSCIYTEAAKCISLNKDTAEHINRQVEYYKTIKYPENNGMCQSGIIIRKHNNPECIKLMTVWWNMVKNYSHRDQLSFNYAVWKTNAKVKYLDKTIFNSEYFEYVKGHKQKNVVKRYSGQCARPCNSTDNSQKVVIAEYVGFPPIDQNYSQDSYNQNEPNPVKIYIPTCCSQDKRCLEKPILEKRCGKKFKAKPAKKIIFKLV